MKKKSVLVFIIFILFNVSCSKSDGNLIELNNMKAFKIFHDNNEKNFNIKNNTNTITSFLKFLNETSDKIGTLDSSLDITFEKIRNVTSEDQDNYYIFIQFEKPQTLSFKKNLNETHKNCDGILFDTNEMILHWSVDGKFVGSMGYTDDTEKIKKDFSEIQQLMQE